MYILLGSLDTSNPSMFLEVLILIVSDDKCLIPDKTRVRRHQFSLAMKIGVKLCRHCIPFFVGQERNTSKPLTGGPHKFGGQQAQGAIKNGHIPTAAERELNGIRDIQRGKSFLEARTAVQKHIEKMLNHSNHQVKISKSLTVLLPNCRNNLFIWLPVGFIIDPIINVMDSQ